jgi:hypothetical protein
VTVTVSLSERWTEVAVKARVFAAVGLILSAATVLILGAYLEAGGCGDMWGRAVADATPLSVGTSAIFEEDTAAYWTEERIESVVAAPMPAC